MADFPLVQGVDRGFLQTAIMGFLNTLIPMNKKGDFLLMSPFAGALFYFINVIFLVSRFPFDSNVARYTPDA
jgi:hypothetical protein